MNFKSTNGRQYSYEELNLITAARPNPIFEDARWFDYKGLFRYVSFNMCDFGMELGKPLLVFGGERVDIIDGMTGEMLKKDCGHGDFELMSPESMYHKIGSNVTSPDISLTEEEFRQIADRAPCCLFKNVVFTNGVVDMVVGKFICPVTSFVEHTCPTRDGEKIFKRAATEIRLQNVGYRFSEKVDRLAFEEKFNTIFMHPDVKCTGVELNRTRISKDGYPEASLHYCSEQAKRAFEKGEAVEAVIIKCSFSDSNAYFSKKGSYRFEAILEGLNRKDAKREWAELSRICGAVKSGGRFSFETAFVLWASNEEANEDMERHSMYGLNVDLCLKVSNGHATEALHDIVEEYGIDFTNVSFSPDEGV